MLVCFSIMHKWLSVTLVSDDSSLFTFSGGGGQFWRLPVQTGQCAENTAKSGEAGRK